LVSTIYLGLFCNILLGEEMIADIIVVFGLFAMFSGIDDLPSLLLSFDEETYY